MELHWMSKFCNPPEVYEMLRNYVDANNRINDQMKINFTIEQKEHSVDKIIEKGIEKALKKYFK